MKDFRIILLLAFLLGGSLVKAQQLPVYTNYIFQPMLYNPSTVGLEKDVELIVNFQSAFSRQAGGPVTGWAGFNMPIRNENFGIGANFSIDNVGARNNISGNVHYAYHIPFSENYEHKLSIGLSAGFFHQRFSITELNAFDLNDPILNLNNNGGTTFDMNVGINYKFKGLDVGFSVPQILDSELSFREGGNVNDTRGVSHLRRHYFLTAGYEIALGKEKNFFLTPSAAMRKIKGLPVQFDGNLMFDWNHILWVGASVKTANGFNRIGSISPFLGFNIKERLDVTYAFATGTDGIVNDDFGYGHEVMITVKFGKRFRAIEARLDTVEQAVKRNAGAIAQNGVKIDSLGNELDSLKGDVAVNQENIAQNTGDINETNENLQNVFTTVEELLQSNANVMYKKVGSVFFKQDRHELTTVAKAKLDAFKDALTTPDGEFFIYLAGNASEEGKEDYNLLLSNRRAAAVKSYLQSIGVSGSIFLLSYGEADPMVDPQRNEEQRAQNRRVDLFISGK